MPIKPPRAARLHGGGDAGAVSPARQPKTPNHQALPACWLSLRLASARKINQHPPLRITGLMGAFWSHLAEHSTEPSTQ